MNKRLFRFYILAQKGGMARQLQRVHRFLFAGGKAVAVNFEKQAAGNKADTFVAVDELMVADNACCGKRSSSAPYQQSKPGYTVWIPR